MSDKIPIAELSAVARQDEIIFALLRPENFLRAVFFLMKILEVSLIIGKNLLRWKNYVQWKKISCLNAKVAGMNVVACPVLYYREKKFSIVRFQNEEI